MCGQIFCNTCSSFYIDGNLFNHQSLVRSCKLCYNQLYEQNERENRLAKRKLLDSNETENSVRNSAKQNMEFSKSNERADADSVNRISNLQNRASMHLIAIINQLVNDITIISEESVKNIWKEIILSLVREVVSTVDPDVKNGDSLDIRDYVKIKVIPGGTRDESIYIDGLLFRKNVSHKKMAVDGNKTHPTILLLTGGIEFQRTDNKLSSMDTLIEQEDKYMEILVDKIMSLKPDIILVGKAVARRAQELLCQHKVVVMQNVKPHLLERVARMTNAMLLPSTDHMIKQFGQECMGTCGQFTLKVVLDDPEKALLAQKRKSLPSRILRGSTYAYFQVF
jgi:chaperonin GroEL (HSP60 family)